MCTDQFREVETSLGLIIKEEVDKEMPIYFIHDITILFWLGIQKLAAIEYSVLTIHSSN